MVYYFHHFSLLSFAANLLILPIQPAIMYLGSTAAMAGLVWLPVGQLLGWVAWLFLTYTIRVVETMANWAGTPGPAGNIHPVALAACYCLLALFTLDMTGTHVSSRAIWRRLRKGMPYQVALVVLLVALVLVWMAVASLPDGRLRVVFLDVGQGDAILVQTPAGRRLLIDGGPSPALLLQALGRRLPFWDRRIDMIILSHPHDDHLRGLLPVLERYHISQVLMGDVAHSSPTIEQWQQLIDERSIPLLTVQHALQINFGDGPIMQVLPSGVATDDDIDQMSLVARLSWQNASFLFTGDLEADGLLRLSDAGWPLACSVLKVPHHGGGGAVSERLLAMTAPSLAIISVGADNRFGHPASSVLELLVQQGIRTLRTDQAGDIEVIADANAMEVKMKHLTTK